MKMTPEPSSISARAKRHKHLLACCSALLVATQMVGACAQHSSTEHVKKPVSENPSGNGGAPDDSDPYASSGNGGKSGSQGSSDDHDGGSTGGTSGESGDASSPYPGDGGDPTADAGPPPPPPEFTKPALLEALADCALDSYRDAEDKVDALVRAVDDLAAEQNLSNLNAAQAAWRGAMASWQRAEPFRVGPAARSTEPGGQDLRDQIYIFPLANLCKIDQQLVAESYAGSGFATLLASTRGLSALEYLLFHNDSTNACLPAANINANGSWAALGSGELARRRATYSKAVARDVRAQVAALLKAWDPEQGDFYGTLTSAGPGNTLFPLPQNAFNAVTDGLFYIEQEVKDWKLGWPLGLVAECINAPGTCPEAVESPYAKVSTDNLRQNLIGFRRAFEGCGDRYWGLGFDDWLNAVGAEDLASRMLTAISDAQTAVDQLDPPLEEAINSDPAKVRAVHTEVKAITDLLKTEFVTVLDLELPKSAEGDND
jgi:predicted lipoprotein